MRTPFKIFFVALFGACSLLPALFIRSVGGFFPACAFAAMLLCAFLAAVWSLWGLRATAQAAQTEPVRGETCRFLLRVENRGPFPLACVAITAAMRVPGGKTLRETHTAALAPGQTLQFELQAGLPHAGPCFFGIEHLAVQDLTGLFTLHRRLGLSTPLVAGPRLEQSDASGAPDKRRTQRAERPAPTRAASGLYGGVRGYAAGDPLRGIHWKLTAHTGDFVSRVYEGSPKPPFDAVLDLSPGAGTADEFDLLLEQPLGAALDALTDGYDVSLLCETDGAPAVHNPQSARELAALGRLLAARPGRGADAARLLEALPHAQAGQVLVCTAHLTDTLRERLLALARQGTGLSVLWVTDLAPEACGQRTQPLTEAGIALRTVRVRADEPPDGQAQHDRPRAGRTQRGKPRAGRKRRAR